MGPGAEGNQARAVDVVVAGGPPSGARGRLPTKEESLIGIYAEEVFVVGGLAPLVKYGDDLRWSAVQ